MTTFELPGYEAIIPYRVFAKKAQLSKEYTFIQDIPVTRLVVLTLSTIPTVKEALEYIITQAKEIQTPTERKHKESKEKNESTLLHALPLLQHFPASELQRIVQEEPAMLEHLQDHFTVGNLEEGRTYFNAFSAVIPSGVLPQLKAMDAKLKDYYGLLQDKGLEDWRLKVRLTEKGAFMGSEEITYLLARGIRDSDVFGISCERTLYQEAAEALQSYSKMLTPQEITRVYDESPWVLESVATHMVKSMFWNLLSEHITQQLSDALGSLGKQEDSLHGENLFFSDLKKRSKKGPTLH